jgi:leucyl aminopeptidase
MVVLPVGKDGALEGIAAAIDAAAQGALAEAIKLAKFKGEPGQTLTLYGVGPHPAVLLIGTGATLKSAVDLRTFGALAAKGTAGWPTDAQVVVPDARDVEHDAAEAALGARLGEYDFGKWGAPAAAGATSQRGSGLTFLAPRAAASKAAFRTEGEAVFEGVAFARDLISTPSNIKSPEWFAGEVRRKFQGVAKTTVTVLDERQIQALGMGALYGTGQGSTRPPRRRPVRSSRWRAVTPR